ncbi:dachshund homolog 2-like [Cololabis saira]|uniref:dachshund homolog 2-like n=1 Tax=Cololabis saira TaxID=129043 RepID=UPI002AD40AAD|nr:dachshund homolog 2-like [Cololabis saira]
MSLPGSPPLLSPGSGAPTPVGLFHHTSVGTSSPAHVNSNSHSLSLTSSMLSAFLPGSGGSGAAGSGFPGAGGPGAPGAGGAPGSGQGAPGAGSGLCSECRLVEVHGVKVASFGSMTDGQQEELICLPQVFDLFLKHLVGGLHTVYTKLKRLDITPVVCTVEQVRVLRGLGAIQPGVNRCKLISRKDFEVLYRDCTSARGLGGNSLSLGPGYFCVAGDERWMTSAARRANN